MVSLASVVLFWLAVLIDRSLNAPLLLTVPGLLLLFWVPGNALVQLLFPRLFGQLEKILFSVLFSLFFNPLAYLFVSSALSRPLDRPTAYLALGGGSSLLLLCQLLVQRRTFFRWPRDPDISWRQLQARHWPLIAGTATYVGVQLVNFIIYPFIPEADGYGFLQSVRAIMKTGTDTPNGTRPLFRLFALLFAFGSNIDLILFLKYLIPLLFGLALIPPYLLARRLRLSSSQLFLAACLPLTFPVILLEMDITRTQSVIILSSFAIVWLLIRFYQERVWSLFGLALFLSVVGLLFHELSVFLVIATVFAGLPPLWERLRSRPRQTVLWLVGLSVGAYPYVRETSLPATFSVIAGQLIGLLRGGGFHPWFISHYVNADGIEVGWPGWTAALYYGYNLGLFSVFLFALAAVRRRRARNGPSASANLYPVWVFFGATFFFAEIAPRFGAAYLPDRAWLFVSISLCFLLVPVLSGITARRTLAFALALTALSGGASWVVTSLKQGYITTDEYQADLWLKTHTPPASQIISQSGNLPGLTSYADRDALADPDFFFYTPAQRQTYVSTLSRSLVTDSGRNQSASQLATVSNTLAQLQASQQAGEVDQLASALSAQIQTYAATRKAELTTPPPAPQPTVKTFYVLYSTEKFSSLYAQRAWWKSENAYGANLTAFAADPALQLVYKNHGVLVWRYDLP